MSSRHASLIFIHSAPRTYRIPLFDAISKFFPTQFIFMDGKPWTDRFPESKHWNYQNLQPYSIFGYTADFSPSLLYHLWKKRKSYNVIISSGLSQFNTHIAFLFSSLFKKKFIVWAEDWVWPNNFWFCIILPYIKWIVRHADACIAAGTKTRDFFFELGVSSEKIFIAPNCALNYTQKKIDHHYLSTLKQRINPSQKIVISYFGRVIRYKALDTLIEAFSKLERERDDLLLLICGDGPFSQECKILLEKLSVRNYFWVGVSNCHDRCSLIEPIPPEQLIYYYHLSHIFVLPGRFFMNENVPCESWGLTINESLSLGIPTVSATSVAAAYDLLSNQYIAKEGNSESLLKVLRYVLSQPLSIIQKDQVRRFTPFATYQYMIEGFQKAVNSTL